VCKIESVLKNTAVFNYVDTIVVTLSEYLFNICKTKKILIFLKRKKNVLYLHSFKKYFTFLIFLRTVSESYLFYCHVQNIYLILLLNYLTIKQFEKCYSSRKLFAKSFISSVLVESKRIWAASSSLTAPASYRVNFYHRD